MEAACVCCHFATQLLNMWQDTAVSDDQRRTPKPNKISHIDINDNCLGRQPANCKTVFPCSGNYYRSRFAEELFNHAAKNAGLNWRASSRGLALEPENIGPVSHFTHQTQPIVPSHHRRV
jgi:hypothetical protein